MVVLVEAMVTTEEEGVDPQENATSAEKQVTGQMHVRTTSVAEKAAHFQAMQSQARRRSPGGKAVAVGVMSLAYVINVVNKAIGPLIVPIIHAVGELALVLEAAVVGLVEIVSNAINLATGPATVRMMKVEDHPIGARVAVEVGGEGEEEVNDSTTYHDCCTTRSIIITHFMYAYRVLRL